MKKNFRAAGIFLLLLTLLIAREARAAEADLVARAHFIGSDQLFAAQDGKKLKEIWTQPGSLALREKFLDRTSALIGDLFNVPNAADTHTLFRPLLEDLLARESYSDFRSAPEMVIAVKLPEARAKAWDAAFRQAVTVWKLGTPAPVNADGMAGWQVKRTQAPQVLRVARLGEWTIVAAGPEKLSVAAALVSKLTAPSQQSRAVWLDGDLNVALLRGWLPELKNFQNLPVAHFIFTNRADSFVETLATLDFPKPHGWKAEPWRVPTNSIFDPVCSFLAIRGIAPVLQAIPDFRQISGGSVPNQIVGWGLRRLPFQFNYAFPSASPSNEIKTLGPKAEAWFRSHSNFVGNLARDATRNDIAWTGLPLAVPHLSALHSSPGFLVFDMFPITATRTPAPKELFETLSRNNLVMFDWEITEDRIAHWRQFHQVAEIATHRRIAATNIPSARFIFDIEHRLGECVTEAMMTSPTQISVVRKSHAGLNAFELVTLARWIDSVDFPRFGTFVPQPTFQKRQPFKLNAPTNAPSKTPAAPAKK